MPRLALTSPAVLGGLSGSRRAQYPRPLGPPQAITHSPTTPFFIPHPRAARWRRRRRGTTPPELLTLGRRVQTVLSPDPFVGIVSSHFLGNRCDLTQCATSRSSGSDHLPFHFHTFSITASEPDFSAFLHKHDENVTSIGSLNKGRRSVLEILHRLWRHSAHAMGTPEGVSTLFCI